jgi:NAD(P)-dependent dehydrogenase (short-subunit alcohol dehydrogenase family)
MDLRGRRALITGAAGGLGGAITSSLAGEGAELVLSDLPGSALERRREDLAADGAQATLVPCDLLDREESGSLISRAEEIAGPIDILVNNAGVEITAKLLDFSDEEIADVLRVNLEVPIGLVRQAVPGMLERGRGHVVSIASLAGKLGPAWMAPYAISKAGVIAMTQSLRAEHADDPVGFSAICPGFVAGAGMIEPLLEAGTNFPSTVALSPPERVGRAVVESIEKDLPEVVFVHRRPIRLVLAMNALMPRLTERLLARSGAQHVFRATTEHRGRLRGRG